MTTSTKPPKEDPTGALAVQVSSITYWIPFYGQLSPNKHWERTDEEQAELDDMAEADKHWMIFDE